jgi:pimeloyl-ACP methyl ester carboxylesterase
MADHRRTKVLLKLRPWLGKMIFPGWLDRPITRGLTRWYMPVSRLWAAALAAEGDPEHLRAQLPLPVTPQLVRDLHETERRRLIHADAHAEWDERLFAKQGSPPDLLLAADTARGDAAVKLAGLRLRFLKYVRAHRICPIRWEISGREDLESAHGKRLAAGESAFDLLDVLPAIEESHAILHQNRRKYWLRFSSPVMPDASPAWAEVQEPLKGRPRLTLIMHHGIGVEFDDWRQPHEPIVPKALNDIRVIRPVGLWHGLRRLPGWFGGEPVFGRAPIAILDYMRAGVAESAALIAWANAKGDGPVVLGGTSLGALVAQLAASVAGRWPVAARPDMLFLICPGRDFVRIAFEGGLTAQSGLGAALAEAGWTADSLKPWRLLAEPMSALAVPPQRTVVVLGRRDDLTFFADAEEMLRNWNIPAENIFATRIGHFTTYLGLMFDDRPLRRLLQIAG